MDISLSNLSQGANSAQPESTKLELDFSWTKFRSYVISPSNPSKPLYSIGFKTMKSQLTFKSGSDDTIFGTGFLPGISIDTECTIHGREIKLRAKKRFTFQYEYLSNVFLKGEDGERKGQTMTWVCDTGLKTWDYVCLDGRQMPVARFQANIWGIKKIGWLELLGEVAEREDMRDEVLVTGITLFYVTVLRSGSWPSFLGAVFATPRKGVKEKEKVENGGKED
ncbi:hypothetical protein N431DRAFT_435876 [Stipitochalara longipes BDJ]|nr:hypothetical protein N431DRAFT_435876 [Stipitochalara longipes BDJ]